MAVPTLIDVRAWYASFPIVRRSIPEVVEAMVLVHEDDVEEPEGAPFDVLEGFDGRFEHRHPFNLPGPFFATESDNCLTGPLAAPGLVLIDEAGHEFVARQPSDPAGLRAMLLAAWSDPFQSYGADGDDFWDLDLLRAALARRGERLAWVEDQLWDAVETPEQVGRHGRNLRSALLDWRAFLRDDLEDYLRAYAFFLEHRRPPGPSDRLPDLGPIP